MGITHKSNFTRALGSTNIIGMKNTILAHILNPISDTECEFYEFGALVVENGKILFCGEREEALEKYPDYPDIDYSDQVMIPGFFDMHFHWVQDDVREMPKDVLLEWLEKYTFPTEAKFADIEYSKERAQKFFRKLLRMGTLGGAIYSSIHPHTVDHAFDHLIGDFIVGNVLMTMNSPKALTQSKEDAINAVANLSSKYKERYAMTPRFAITTDPQTMREGARIAKNNHSFMQTHLSENHDEIKAVKEIYSSLDGFQDIESYTDVYERVGMLSDKTIMGHGIHLEPSELEKLSQTQTAVAHCPTSNAPHDELGLESGLFDFKKIEQHNIPWALASDIGGGPFLSMFDVMRSFVDQNKKAGITEATYVKALYRSTVAGAKILQLKDCGNFEIGKYANFSLVNVPEDLSSPEAILASMIENRPRESYKDKVNNVFYQGKQVL